MLTATRPRMLAVPLALAAALALPATRAQAQSPCNPVSASSNEAKLLQLFTTPLAFSAIEQPARLSAGVTILVLEATQVPKAEGADRITQCGPANRRVNANLTDVTPRPRLIVGLPQGFAAEFTWMPPLTIGDATPSIYGAALSWTLRAGIFAGNSLRVQFRGHVTRGDVSGPITCPVEDLRPDATAPCYGTQPSKDHYRPNASGGEAILAVDGPGYGFYAGSGATVMSPELEVNFTNGAGVTNTTLVKSPQATHYPILLGGSLRFTEEIALLGQYYIVPSTTSLLRVGASVRLR